MLNQYNHRTRAGAWLTLLFLFCFGSSWAQSLANYAVSRQTGITYTSIASTGTGITSWRNGVDDDENFSFPIPIGFTFVYNGTPYTSAQVSVNGYLTFASTTGPSPAITTNPWGYENSQFSAANVASLAPFYDDLQLNATVTGSAAASLGLLANQMKYQTTGSVGSRVFTAEWIGESQFANVSQNMNFQVKLFETTGAIQFVYGTMNTLYNSGYTYTLGLTGQSLSNPPTAAQLLTQNVENTTTFTNGVSNALIVAPVSFSRYTFTPSAVSPSAPSALSFSSVSNTAMTLNWTDNSNNETGFAIYRSDDGGTTYSWVGTTVANAINSTQSGLAPGTTYFWRVFSVREGTISASAASGSQTTLSGSITASANGNWSNAATWGGSVPTLNDNVIIPNGVTVTIDQLAVAKCLDLTVNGTLRYESTLNATLNVMGNLTVGSSGAFTAGTGVSLSHTLSVGGQTGTDKDRLVSGNITVDGNLDLSGASSAALTLYGLVNASISGSGTIDFHTVTVNKGGANATPVAPNSTLTINRGFTVQGANTTGAFTLTNGLVSIDGSFTQSNPFFNLASWTIPTTAGLRINNANFTVTAQNAATSTVNGRLEINGSVFNVGTLDQQRLTFGAQSVFILNSGVVNVAGQFYSTSAFFFTQTGGAINVPTVDNTSTTIQSFGITATAAYAVVTGGTINLLRRAGTAGVFGQDYQFGLFNIGQLVMTGGTLNLGNATTPTPTSIITANVVSGGSGYAVGNTLTSTGGTGTPVSLTVTEINASGAVVSAVVTAGQWGNYSIMPSGTVGVTGGAGTGATFTLGAGTPFRIRGDVYNLVIDNTTTNKAVWQSAQLNVRNTLTANSGTLYNQNGFTTLVLGPSLTINGVFNGYPTGSSLQFGSGTNIGAQSIGGTGVFVPLRALSNSNANTLTLNIPIKAIAVRVFLGTINNSTNSLTLGTGGADNTSIQYGNASLTVFATVGGLTAAPVWNVGSAATLPYSVTYANEAGARTTGVEIPSATAGGVTANTVANMLVANPNGVIQSQASITVTGTLTLGFNLPPVFNSVYNVGNNNLTLGSSATVTGTLATVVGNSGILTGASGTFTRWYGIATSLPGNIAGQFPFVNAAGDNLSFWANPSTAFAAGGGTVSARCNFAGGTSALTSFNDAAAVPYAVNNIDTRSNTTWTVTGTTGSGAAFATRAVFTNAITTVNTGELRMVSTTAANPIGTSTAVSAGPAVNKTLLSLVQLANTWAVGTSSANAQRVVVSVATGNWSSAGTWNIGAVPTANDLVTVATGHTVTVDNAAATGFNLTVQTGATLVNTSGTLTVNGLFTNNGTFTNNGGTTNVVGNLAATTGSVVTGFGGSGYVVGDVVDVTAGNGAGILNARFTVATVTAGAITGISLVGGGAYTVFPNTPTASNVTAVTGSGTGARVTLSVLATATPYAVVMVQATGGQQPLFNVTSGTVNVGASGGGNRGFQSSTFGWLTVTGGTLNINGQAALAAGAVGATTASRITFTGGNINVDGNDGTFAGSIPSGSFHVTLANRHTNEVTGGTFTMVDPSFAETGTTALFNFAATNTSNFAGMTLVLGGTSGTNASNSRVGFRVNTGSSLILGNVVVNGTGSNRYTSSGTAFQVGGTFTVNAGSEYRSQGNALAAGGNLVNNGVIFMNSTLHLARGLSLLPAFAPTTLSGSGTFSDVNTSPPTSLALAGSGYVLGDVLTVVGGTGTAATLTVSGVNATGGITSAALTTPGAYTVAPTNPVSVTGGTGTGATVNLATGLVRTGDVFNLTVNNTSPDAGVTFSYPSLQVSGTLTMTAGNINLGGNALTLGVSPTSAGTLTYTRGVITNTAGGSFTRWVGTSAFTSSNTLFPMGTTTTIDRRFYCTAGTPTVGGTITVTHNDATGLVAVSPVFTDASNGAIDVDTKTSASWLLSTGNGLTVTGVTAALKGNNLFPYANAIANTRMILNGALAPGTHGTAGTLVTNLDVTRTGLTNADLSGTFTLGGSGANYPTIFTAVTNGNWDDGSTWDTNGDNVADNVTPAIADNVVIGQPWNIVIPASVSALCNDVQLNANAALNLPTATSTLRIGGLNGGNKVLNVGGTLTIGGGSVQISGNAVFSATSTLNMSSGTFIVDGNAAVAANSVLSGTDLLSFTSGASGVSINVTGGTIRVVDPPSQGTTGMAIRINKPLGSTATTSFAGSTLEFGNGTSSTGGMANGFQINTFAGSINVPLGDVVVNAGSAGTRQVRLSGTAAIEGTLTINSGSVMNITSGNTLSMNGTISNSGTLITSGTLSYTPVTLSPTAGILGGGGTFRNTYPSATISTAGTSYTVGNVLTVQGGTASTPATLRVINVNSSTGAITEVQIENPGAYTVAPTNPVSITGGLGTGAEFNLSNLLDPTANFTNMTVNNALGLTVNSITPVGTGSVSGTLNMTLGNLNVTTNDFVLGTSATSTGTFTYTAGFSQMSTGRFGRWINTTTLPTLTGTVFLVAPCGSGADRRDVWAYRTGAFTAGGILFGGHSYSGGTFQLPGGIDNYDDNGVTVDRHSQSSWTFGSGGGLDLGGNNLHMEVAGGGIGSITNLADARLVKYPFEGDNVTPFNTNSTGAGINSTLLAPRVQRTFVQADLTGGIFNTPFNVGGNSGTATLQPTAIAIATGNWNDPNTWSTNPDLPTSSQAVLILGGVTVDLNVNAQVASMAINQSGALNMAANTLGVGTSGGALSITGTLNQSGGTLNVGGLTTGTTALTINNNGTYNLSGGTANVGPAIATGGNKSIVVGGGTTGAFNMSGTSTLNVSGNILVNSGATFGQTGGNIFLNPNTGTDVSSTASGVHTFSILSNNVNCTAGGVTIINPPHNSLAASTTFSVRVAATANATRFTGTHTFTFGDGTAALPANANGFSIETYASGRVPLNNVVVNSGTDATRFVSSSYNTSTGNGTHIQGNLTINSGSEFRTNNSGSEFAVGGNILNNGTFTVQKNLILGSTATYTIAAPQTIGGSGVWQNLLPTPDASLTGFTVNNAGGVTLNVPLTLSGTLTLTSGLVNTSSTNTLTLNGTTVGSLVGGSATAYVNGPFARTLPASLATGTTYTFPVGKGGSYNPFALVDATTNAGGTVVVNAEVFTGATGGSGNGTTVGSLLTNRYWSASFVSGSANFTNANVRLTDAIALNNLIARSATLTGTYGKVSNIANAVATDITTTPALTSLGFFALGLPPNCAGTPSPGTIAAQLQGCAGSPNTISITNNPQSLGITYQWEQSANGTNNWASVSGGTGATTAVYTTPNFTTTTHYRCKVTCSNGGAFAYTNVCMVSFTNPLPFTQNFDGVTAPTMPCGWSVENVNADANTWTTFAQNPLSGTNSLRYLYNTTNAANDWAYTPPVLMDPAYIYTLKFSYRTSSTLYTENLRVSYGTAANNAAMTNELFVTENYGNTSYAEQTITITPASAGTYYVGFQCFSAADQDRLHIDNVTLSAAPAANCGTAPTIAAATNITLDGAKLNWTPIAVATQYQVRYKRVSDPTSVATWATPTVVTAPANSLTLTGLLCSTDYMWSMRATCTGAVVSTYSTTGLFSTSLCNDLVSGAVDLSGTIGDKVTYIPFNNSTANTETTPVADGIGTRFSLWYKVTGVEQLYLLAKPTTSATGNIIDPDLRVYTSSDNTANGTFTQLANNDGGFIGNPGYYPYLGLTGLTPATTYFILLGNYENAPAERGKGVFGYATAANWEGGTSTNWGTINNWFSIVNTSTTLPASPYKVYVNNVANKPNIAAATTVEALDVTVAPSAWITTSAATSVLNVNRNWTSNSNTVGGLGKVVFNTSTNGTLSGAATFNNVEFSKSGAGTFTISPSATLGVNVYAQQTSGTLVTNDRLFLRSNATTTAHWRPQTGTLTGNIVVERYTISGQHFLANPTNNGLATSANLGDDFNVAGSPANYQYNPDPTSVQPTVFPTTWWFNEAATQFQTNDAVGWSNAISTPMTSGLGIAAFITTPTAMLDFVGEPTNGTLTSVNVTKIGANGWNLIGNPYPQPISWTAFRTTNSTKIAPTVYIWNPRVNQYASLIGTTWTNNAGAGTNVAIGHSQGFLVKALQSGTQSLTFNNSHRVTTDAFIFLEEKNKALRLEIDNAGRTDETVLDFTSGGSMSYEVDHDAQKLIPVFVKSSNIFTVSDDNVKLAINSVGALNEDMVIPVGVVVSDAGKTTIKATDLSGVDLFTEVYLEDAVAKKMVNLKESSYSVELPSGNSGSRFFLHFRAPGNAVATAAERFGIYSNNDLLYVNIPGDVKGQVTVEVMNLLGQNIQTVDASNAVGRKEINLSGVVSGNYLVRIVNGGQVYTNKVFIGTTK